MQLDGTDREIIRLLGQDGRATYSQISKAIGVSVGTVRNRIKAMRESGALHLNVWLDPYRVGLGITATLLIRVEAGSLDRVIDAITKLDSTGYVAVLAGDHNLMVDAFCRDVPHPNTVLHDEIENIEGVLSVTSYVVTDIRYESSMNLAALMSNDDPDSAASSADSPDRAKRGGRGRS